MTPEQKERRKKLRQFALAVADPSSPSYANNVDSYVFAFGVTEADIKAEGLPKIVSKAHRARHLPFVLKVVEEIQKKVQTFAGLTMPEYVQLLLKREAQYAHRGIPGDAAASARLLQFLGKAAGHLADKPATPEGDSRPLLSGEEIANALIDAAQRLQRLREPNPTPAQARLAAGEEIIVEPEEEK